MFKNQVPNKGQRIKIESKIKKKILQNRILLSYDIY